MDPDISLEVGVKFTWEYYFCAIGTRNSLGVQHLTYQQFLGVGRWEDWPSRVPPSGRKCDITPAFSGVPIQGDKIRSGCLTPTFSGAHKWSEVLRNPCFLGGPQTRGQNQKGLPQPCLLRGQNQIWCIKKKAGRATKKAYLAFFKRKSVTRLFFSGSWLRLKKV